MEKRYYSAVDWWLALILAGVPAALIISGACIGDKILMLSGLLVGVVIALLAVPCHYTLTNQALIIKCGLIKQTIPLEKIHDAGKTYNPLSSPALSIKRVKVTGTNGKILTLVSPKDRDAFIADLKTRLAK
ncbi:MAG: PH domain-containing protein [Verrucomicrobiales bacterium]|jgi:hypothetical protein|nr:PH domain-containing protein [Verrucomicrobiales bacterium]